MNASVVEISQQAFQALDVIRSESERDDEILCFSLCHNSTYSLFEFLPNLLFGLSLIISQLAPEGLADYKPGPHSGL